MRLYEGIILKNDELIYKNSDRDVHLKTQSGVYNTTKSKTGDLSYFKAYQYDKGIKHHIRDTISKKIKDLDLDSNLLRILVNKSIMQFGNVFDVTDTDYIMAPESGSELNNYILDAMSNKIEGAKIIDKAFIKNSIDDITINYDAISKLPKKTQDDITKHLNRALGKKPWKMKNVYGKYKKFISNIMRINPDVLTLGKINGKNIIIIDDVSTEKTTLKEMYKLCIDAGAANVIGFVFLTKN